MRRRALTFIAVLAFTAGCRSPQPASVPPSPAAPPRAENLPTSIAGAVQLRGDASRYTRALESLMRSSDATTARHARALYAIARAAEGDHQGAIRLLENAANDSPLLAPKILVELGRSRAAAGDPRGALDTARTVVASYPDSGAAIEARLLAPALAIRYGDP